MGRLWVEFPRLLLAVVAGYFLARQVLPLSLSERDFDLLGKKTLIVLLDISLILNNTIDPYSVTIC